MSQDENIEKLRQWWQAAPKDERLAIKITAAAASQGLVMNTHNFDNMTDKSIAENAYLIADAMIEARKGES